ncbi:MAG: helix-turn-helix transcriptional regulator [Streptosporangiaceae bacterium]|nr:helix-turn-helix transcriptional regulator [Streptosporangiaceae bacterium]
MAVSPNANGAIVQLPYPPLGAAELSAADAERMAAMFKALADPVRLRLFSRLAALADEACVCEIQDVGVSQPTVSHHLKKLREAGLIVSERRGTWVYCRVAPGILPAMARMLAPGLDKVPRPLESSENACITGPPAGLRELPRRRQRRPPGGHYLPDRAISATRPAAATRVTNRIASRGR